MIHTTNKLTAPINIFEFISVNSKIILKNIPRFRSTTKLGLMQMLAQISFS